MHHARFFSLALVVSLLGPSAALSQRRPVRRPPARTATAPAAEGIGAVRTCAAVRATFTPSTMTRRNCPEIACQNGLSIDLSDVPQGPGLYRFEITADGQRFTCEQRLPWSSCDALNACEWRVAGTYTGIMISQINCARPPAEHAFGSVDLHDVCPSTVSVRLTRDGQLVRAWSASPTYRRVVPGGEGCGMMCASGGVIPRGEVLSR